MIALLGLVLAVLVAPFKSKSRLEAENAVLRHQLIVLRHKVHGRRKRRTKLLHRGSLDNCHLCGHSYLLTIRGACARGRNMGAVERSPRSGACQENRQTHLIAVVGTQSFLVVHRFDIHLARAELGIGNLDQGIGPVDNRGH